MIHKLCLLIFICVHAGCSAVVRLHSAKISCHCVLSKSKHLDFFFFHVRLEEIKPNCGNWAKNSAHIFLCSQFVWFLIKITVCPRMETSQKTKLITHVTHMLSTVCVHIFWKVWVMHCSHSFTSYRPHFLPYPSSLSRSLSVSVIFQGLLSFLSAPLIGALSDVWGRKSFLLLTVFFTCAPIPLMKISPWWVKNTDKSRFKAKKKK